MVIVNGLDGNSHTLCSWDAGVLVRRQKLPQKVNKYAFFPNSNNLVVVTEGQLCLWSLSEPEKQWVEKSSLEYVHDDVLDPVFLDRDTFAITHSDDGRTLCSVDSFDLRGTKLVGRCLMGYRYQRFPCEPDEDRVLLQMSPCRRWIMSL